VTSSGATPGSVPMAIYPAPKVIRIRAERQSARGRPGNQHGHQTAPIRQGANDLGVPIGPER
jgi:hypothetical protein